MEKYFKILAFYKFIYIANQHKLADDINVSLVKEQVELGVAVRMACLKIYCK